MSKKRFVYLPRFRTEGRDAAEGEKGRWNGNHWESTNTSSSLAQLLSSTTTRLIWYLIQASWTCQEPNKHEHTNQCHCKLSTHTLTCSFMQKDFNSFPLSGRRVVPGLVARQSLQGKHKEEMQTHSNTVTGWSNGRQWATGSPSWCKVSNTFLWSFSLFPLRMKEPAIIKPLCPPTTQPQSLQYYSTCMETDHVI